MFRIVLQLTFLTIFLASFAACGGDKGNQEPAKEDAKVTHTDPAIKAEGNYKVYTIEGEDADVMGPSHMYLYDTGYFIFMTGLSDTEMDTHYLNAFGGTYTIKDGIIDITIDKMARVLQQDMQNASSFFEPIKDDKWLQVQFAFEKKDTSVLLSKKNEVQKALIPHLKINEGEYKEAKPRE